MHHFTTNIKPVIWQNKPYLLTTDFSFYDQKSRSDKPTVIRLKDLSKTQHHVIPISVSSCHQTASKSDQ